MLGRQFKQQGQSLARGGFQRCRSNLLLTGNAVLLALLGLALGKFLPLLAVALFTLGALLGLALCFGSFCLGASLGLLLLERDALGFQLAPFGFHLCLLGRTSGAFLVFPLPALGGFEGFALLSLNPFGFGTLSRLGGKSLAFGLKLALAGLGFLRRIVQLAQLGNG